MNRTRRRVITKLVERLEEIKSELETVQEEERAAYDNRPESFLETDAGLQASEQADNLDQAVSTLEDLISTLNDLV
jgi:hypothetical protein